MRPHWGINNEANVVWRNYFFGLIAQNITQKILADWWFQDSKQTLSFIRIPYRPDQLVRCWPTKIDTKNKAKYHKSKFCRLLIVYRNLQIPAQIVLFSSLATQKCTKIFGSRFENVFQIIGCFLKPTQECWYFLRVFCIM